MWSLVATSTSQSTRCHRISQDSQHLKTQDLNYESISWLLINLTSKSYSHLPTYYVKQQEMSKTQLLKDWHTAPSGGSNHAFYAPLCVCICCKTALWTQHTAIPSWHRQKHDQWALPQCQCHEICHLEPMPWPWIFSVFAADPTSASYSNIWLPFMWWHLSMTTGPLRRETSRQRSSVLISLSAV